MKHIALIQIYYYLKFFKTKNRKMKVLLSKKRSNIKSNYSVPSINLLLHHLFDVVKKELQLDLDYSYLDHS